MKKIIFRQPVWLCIVYYYLLRYDSTGILRMGLIAAIWHELGHVVVWRIETGKFPALEVTVGGICLQRDGTMMSAWQELILAMAGPAANFILGGILIFWNAEIKAGYGRYAFASVNLLLGAFNLLPVGKLDGRYLLIFCREKLQSERK